MIIGTQTDQLYLSINTKELCVSVTLQTSTNVPVFRVRMAQHVMMTLTPINALVWMATTAPIARLVCLNISPGIPLAITCSVTAVVNVTYGEVITFSSCHCKQKCI